MRQSTARLGAAITRAASRQTYLTIRLLVDRRCVDDAFRAYAYFRWVDDLLDAERPDASAEHGTPPFDRASFLERQRSLLDACLRGEPPDGVERHEAMLVDLVRHADRTDGLVEAYLRNLMQVMEFDVRRQGRLVTEAELDDYTRWLAVAVTAAMDHFIGNGAAAPDDESRYRAVSGAHILHMLRDTAMDIRAGYFNIPSEWLERYSIGPRNVDCEAYRAWVAARVERARCDLAAGRAYYRRVPSRRHRLAGFAYITRFEWLIAELERDGFRLRDRYERRSAPAGIRMGVLALTGLVGLHRPGRNARPTLASVRGVRP